MVQNKIDFYKKLKKGIFKTFSANVVNKAVGLISTMVITRLLSTSDYGIWCYAINIYSYLLLVTGFGLISGCLQFGAEHAGKKRAYCFFKYCTNKGLIIDFLLLLVCSLIIIAIQLPIEGAKSFVLVILPVLLVEYISSIGQCILRTQNRINEYALYLNVNTILVSLGTCIGALEGLKGIVIGRYIAYLLSIIFLFYILKNDIRLIKKADVLIKQEKKQLWHYSLFIGASSAMNCLLYYLDISFIAVLIKNASDVAIYSVGTIIPNALQFIPDSIIIAILPTIIFNRHKIDWIKKIVKKLYLFLFVLNFFIVFILLLEGTLIIKIICGEKYLSSVPILSVLSIGYFVSGTFRSLSLNLLASFRRVHFCLFISVLSCIFDLSLNYVLIMKYGVIGAAYATLGVDFIAAIISFSYFMVLLRNGKIIKKD